MKKGTPDFDLAFLASGTVGTSFSLSLTETIRTYPNVRIWHAPSKKIVLQKNHITREWLRRSRKDWLLWIDADMSWEPPAVQALLDKASVPAIYSGLWFHHSPEGHIYPGFFPKREGDRLYATMNSWLEFPSTYAFEVEATGGGFMLVHREVFETLNDPDTEHPFFEATIDPPAGYTHTFCMRAKDAGFPIVVEPRAQIGHNETIALTRDHYDRHWSVG